MTGNFRGDVVRSLDIVRQTVYTTRRRQASVAFEYHWLIHNLAQGSYPNPPTEAFETFDVLVLCAEEHQPTVRCPNGKYVFKLPLDDDIYNQIPPEVASVILQTAHAVGTYLRAGCKVVTTCHQGLNRSGLMSGLLLMNCYGMSVDEAIKLIRRERDPDALCNPMFEQFLRSADLYQ